MKKYNSLIDPVDIWTDIPSTDCIGTSCMNHAHEMNTNLRTRGHEQGTSYGQVNFMGEAMKSTEHRSKNPSTWGFP